MGDGARQEHAFQDGGSGRVHQIRQEVMRRVAALPDVGPFSVFVVFFDVIGLVGLKESCSMYRLEPDFFFNLWNFKGVGHLFTFFISAAFQVLVAKSSTFVGSQLVPIKVFVVVC